MNIELLRNSPSAGIVRLMLDRDFSLVFGASLFDLFSSIHFAPSKMGSVSISLRDLTVASDWSRIF